MSAATVDRLADALRETLYYVELFANGVATCEGDTIATQEEAARDLEKAHAALRAAA